jgi:hypothetical protein
MLMRGVPAAATTLKSWMTKSVGAQAAWAASGEVRNNRAEANKVFMGDFVNGMSLQMRRNPDRPLLAELEPSTKPQARAARGFRHGPETRGEASEWSAP